MLQTIEVILAIGWVLLFWLTILWVHGLKSETKPVKMPAIMTDPDTNKKVPVVLLGKEEKKTQNQKK